MSQNYTDDCFAPGHVGQTDLQNMENNFAALKSAFSGASAPSNPVAGMIWIDTTNDLLKRYYDGSWISIWDLANNKPIITNLSNEITCDMIASSCKDAAAGTASLRTLGTGATQAAAGNQAPPNGSVTEVKMASSAISQAKLKTSMGNVSYIGSTWSKFTLPGGQYGFYPQIKMQDTSQRTWGAVICNPTVDIVQGWTSYTTAIYLRSSGSHYIYAQQRYVTSSGEVHWFYILRDKITNQIYSVWQAPDHPCFGNGGKPQLVPHPFPDYDDSKFEIIVVNPSFEEITQMKKRTIAESETQPDRDLIEVFLDEYELDETIQPPWPSKPVTVGLPPEWEEKSTGSIIEPVRKVIPKPSMVKTAKLRLKRQSRRI